DGNVFITGNYSQDFGIGTCYVTKLNSAGNLIWTKEIGQSSAGTSIKVDALKNVYVAGRFSSGQDLDPAPDVVAVTDGVFFFCKLDANGNFIWATGMGDT